MFTVRCSSHFMMNQLFHYLILIENVIALCTVSPYKVKPSCRTLLYIIHVTVRLLNKLNMVRLVALSFIWRLKDPRY